MLPPVSDYSREMRESLGEVEELLEKIGQGLTALISVAGKGKVPPALINAVFRDAHNLKSLAAMLGYTLVSRLSHGMENLLELLRLEKTPLDTQTLEVLEAALDHLSLLVLATGRGDVPPDISSILERIAESCNRTAAVPDGILPQPLLPERITRALTGFEENCLAENLQRGVRLFLLHASFHLESYEKEIESLYALLKTVGETICTVASPCFDREDAIDFDILFGADAPPESFPSNVRCEEIEVMSAVVSTPVEEQSLKSQHCTPVPSRQRVVTERIASGTVRVDIRALDDLIALVGELVAAQRSLRGEVEQVKRDGSAAVAGMVKHAGRIGTKLKELQRGVMDIRLVPVRTLYDKLVRVVRRIAVDEGRRLELELHGGETRLDKQIIEDISDPLMHLVRNAVDHGIETSLERLAVGKPETGRITITANQKGSRVVIEVADDGRGINVNKVRRQAVAKGLLRNPEDATDREVLEMIFEPGFSTRDEVSELSGRGVGMDVVKSALTALSGTVSVETESGKGSRIILATPVTLAIVRTLVIQAGSETYGVPVSVIQETVALTKEELLTLEGNEFLQLREITLPVVRLGRLFGEASPVSDDVPGYAVIAVAGTRRVGIFADDIRGQHDLVLKPLGEFFAGVRGIAGAVELSDDETILVLDPLAIIDEVYRSRDSRGF